MEFQSERVRVEKGSTATVMRGLFFITLTSATMDKAKFTLGAVGRENVYVELSPGEFFIYDAKDKGKYEIRLLSLELTYRESAEFLVSKLEG